MKPRDRKLYKQQKFLARVGMLGPQLNASMSLDPSMEFESSFDDPTLSLSFGSLPGFSMGDDIMDDIDVSKMSATERRKYNQKKRQKRKKSASSSLSLDDEDGPKQPKKVSL
jgi:hypothetical protein